MASNAWRLKKGDMVFVRSGKDKGKTGKIIEVLRSDRRVVVSGINYLTRHMKPSPRYPDGGKIREEAPLYASKVGFLDEVSGRPTRLGFRVEKERKVRYAKRSGRVVD